ncbi:GerMN domain-containing protein [Calothrix sp. NIES-3974]|uniref:GerMN domain-containing protein n=1 Tax=Calothrix sp. NIES-3974 TaxID=2005462 RepID=UPI000B5F3EEE|nr:GerMN domain-containing protein [Calothrix sp. NIES-3974]BAZ08062.1 hypothetical protein NIES3974_47310 [Calothrix sp. NIES-3974]
MKEQERNRISSGVVAAVSAAVVAVSGGVAWFTWNYTNPPVPNQQGNITGHQSPSGSIAGVEQTVNIYLIKDSGTNLVLVPFPVQVKVSKDNPSQALEAVFNRLMTVKNDGDTSSTIPEGTKLLGVRVENDGIHVNLSEEFTSGGGSASMTGRLGQVIYTATTFNANANVFIEVNGKRLEVLGGEGLELDQPLTRESFNREYQL